MIEFQLNPRGHQRFICQSRIRSSPPAPAEESGGTLFTPFARCKRPFLFAATRVRIPEVGD
jgi:hypothetical protein